ncbi:MAG: hypothetical protein IK005_08700 [Paludibacteraceae bacterium]|nr:hypothetical protein [Paludibacteraceae bacterium]
MKHFLHILFLLCALAAFSSSAEAQIVRFKSYRSAEGTSGLDKNGLFSWGCWGANKTEITLDLGNESIYVENLETKEAHDYKIFGRPKKWVIKRDHKYVSFECADENYDKVNIKLYQYDNGEYRLSVLTLNRAVRYSVVYEDQMMKDKKIFD